MISLFEDVLAFFTVVFAFLAPLLVPVLLIALALIVGLAARRVRARLRRQRADIASDAPA